VTGTAQNTAAMTATPMRKGKFRGNAARMEGVKTGIRPRMGYTAGAALPAGASAGSFARAVFGLSSR
jgi:hypothetical protein